MAHMTDPSINQVILSFKPSRSLVKGYWAPVIILTSPMWQSRPRRGPDVVHHVASAVKSRRFGMVRAWKPDPPKDTNSKSRYNPARTWN